MVGIFKKSFKSSKLPPLKLSGDKRNEVRKWLNHFFYSGSVEDEFWQAVEVYRGKNGYNPRVNDIIWGLLQKQRQEELKQGLLGPYSTTTMDMCKLLSGEDRYAECLFHASQFTYLHGVGASQINIGYENEFPACDLEQAFIGSTSAPFIGGCALELGLSLDDTKEIFIEAAQKQVDSLGNL